MSLGRMKKPQITNKNMLTRCLLIILLFSISCRSQVKESSKANYETVYDFEVLYRFQGEKNVNVDKNRYKISSDSLYFILESHFDKDLVSIGTEKKVLFKGIVETEQSSGVAREVIIWGLENGEEVLIRINSGQPIAFKLINKEHNIIGIRKTEEKVSILFYKEVPSFY
jgi:hypothetical protein